MSVIHRVNNFTDSELDIMAMVYRYKGYTYDQLVKKAVYELYWDLKYIPNMNIFVELEELYKEYCNPNQQRSNKVRVAHEDVYYRELFDAYMIDAQKKRKEYITDEEMKEKIYRQMKYPERYYVNSQLVEAIKSGELTLRVIEPGYFTMLIILYFLKKYRLLKKKHPLAKNQTKNHRS